MKNYTCDRCGRPIEVIRFGLGVSSHWWGLTGRPGPVRITARDSDLWVDLCHDCSDEAQSIIKSWVASGPASSARPQGQPSAASPGLQG